MIIRACILSFGIAAFMTGPILCSAEPPHPDGGKFTLLLQGKSVGTDTFRLLPDGSDSDVRITTGTGPALQFHQTLKFKKGKWTEAETNAGAQGTMTLALAGAKSTVKAGEKPAIVQKLPESPLPYGDRSPHLLAFMVAGYDARRGGDQKFDLVFSEGLGPKGVLVIAAVLKAPETASRVVGGKSMSISRYGVTLTGAAGPISMEILTDKDRHILYWNVPAQKYSAVRTGFQELAK